jgi:membrane-bound metal-dependent hydrolase YbcI (DUF457 family)
MFIGHFGAAFAAKKVSKKASLGTYILASQFIDLLWPILVLLGIEKVLIDPGNTAFTPLNFIYYPFSHSFLAVVIWGLLFGLIYYTLKKDTKTSIVLFLLVISHWILDLLTHRADLPIFPWSDFKVGLGLWNNVFLTIILESIIFIGGVYLYTRVTESKNKKGTIALISLVVFLGIIYIMNIVSPPPPDEKAIGYAGLLMWLFVAWGYWIDRNRSTI